MSDTPVVPVPVSVALPPLPTVSSASRRSLRKLLRHGVRRPGRLLTIGLLVSLIGLGSAVARLYVRAYFHFRSGRADLERHHNAPALAHFQAYLRTRPNNPDALLLSARASWRLQQLDEAERYLKEYQQVAGTTEDYVRESAFIMAARGQVDEAKEYCQDLLKRRDAATPLILEAAVTGYLQQYRLAEAAVLLRNWLQMLPDDTQALFLQGSLDFLRYGYEEAITRYRRILELDPEHDSARFQLAVTLVEQRQYQEALSHLEMLRQRQPDNKRAVVFLARCQDSLGQPEAAEQLLDQLLAQAPHHAGALAARGRLALRRGQLADAEAWLRHALVHEPADYQARYHLLQCLLQQGKTAKARVEEQRLKQMEKDQTRIREIVTQEMSEKPHDPALLDELALIFLRSGDTKEGIRCLHNSLRANPRSVPVHRALAEYYHRIGDTTRAAYHRQFVPPQSAEPAHKGS